MTEAVALENFSILPQGKTLTFRVSPGQSVAVLGAAASGKSRFIRCLAGMDRPSQGTVHVLGSAALASREHFSKRSTPQSIARAAAQAAKSPNLAEALMVTGLWDLRQVPISDLTSSQIAGCELLSCLASDAKLLLVDGQLDRLDPWTLNAVLSYLKKRASLGCALVAASNRPELLPQFDSVLVLDAQRCAFAGTLRELLLKGPESEIQIESILQPGVRALVDSFRIDVRQREEGLVFRAADGQEVAARLLLEGYGDVKFVILRQPTAEQALMHLTKSPLKKPAKS